LPKKLMEILTQTAINVWINNHNNGFQVNGQFCSRK
jgi:hypothetical protein